MEQYTALGITDTDLEDKVEHLARPLLQWYSKEKRALPWRKNKNPYSIWVSEIMLQQTRVEAVKPYYQRFTEQLPTVQALAEVDEESLMKLWEGLGYYSRVKNMQKAAKVIVEEHEGVFPDEYDQLLRLPGIGEYTAGAIGSIAFELPVPAVDGNVYRVFARIFGSYGDITKLKVKKEFYKLVKQSLPKNQIGDYNQAIMELGATICIPKGAPLCNRCPLSEYCVASERQIMEQLPIKTGKKARKIEKRTVFVFIADNKVLLHKREDKGLLAGLWEVPNQLGELEQDELKREIMRWGQTDEPWYRLLPAKHIFSHIEWHMDGYLIYLNQCLERDGYAWATLEEVEKIYSLPSAFKSYSSQLNKWIKRKK